jgi:hypothetical protein
MPLRKDKRLSERFQIAPIHQSNIETTQMSDAQFDTWKRIKYNLKNLLW